MAEGQAYEVVVSSFCGLRRYRMGDRLRCCGRYGAAPVFEHLGRAGQVRGCRARRLGRCTPVSGRGALLAPASGAATADACTCRRPWQALNVIAEKYGEDALVAAVGAAIARALPGGNLAAKVSSHQALGLAWLAGWVTPSPLLEQGWQGRLGPLCAAPETFPLQDWAAAEELHMGPGSRTGSEGDAGLGLVGAGHYLLYLELAAPVPGGPAGQGGRGTRGVERAGDAAARGCQVASVARCRLSADLHVCAVPYPPAGQQLAAFEAELQRRLAAANAQYAEYVQEGRLGRPELRLLRPGAFLALRAEAVARGAAPAQCKPPVVVPPGGWQQARLERWRQQFGSE